MKLIPLRTQRLALGLALLTVLVPLAAQELEVDGIEDTVSGSRVGTANDEFVIDLTIEPLAGQTLQAGEFEVEFLSALPTGDAPPQPPEIFTNGFESTGVTP